MIHDLGNGTGGKPTVGCLRLLVVRLHDGNLLLEPFHVLHMALDETTISQNLQDPEATVSHLRHGLDGPHCPSGFVPASMDAAVLLFVQPKQKQVIRYPVGPNLAHDTDP